MTPFQLEVKRWLTECVGDTDANNKQLRNWRFLEEALELVQSCGATSEEAISLVDYVYSRPIGEKFQEVGGVLTTLHALCRANQINMHDAGDKALIENWSRIEKIREKQKNKPRYSPLLI